MHGLEVEVSVEEPAVCLQEDVMILVFQAVRELLFNVTKHAGVSTASMGVCRAGDQIRITVVDKGAGFDPATLRGDIHLNGGFGLFNVRERLSHLGGCMEIDSAPGRGSRFTLAVPIGAPAAPPPAEVREADRRPGPAAPAPAAGVGKIRVLLADDHAVTRQGLARLLREEPDIEVVAEAADGQAAIDLTRELLPHVVVMDVIMPGMPGIEATRRIHADHPDVKIIALSMFEESEQGANLRKAGAVDYLTKAGPLEAVVAAIRTHARRVPGAIPIIEITPGARRDGPGSRVGREARGRKYEVRSKKQEVRSNKK
jgi:CheY-like chemotaxis protein